jgi:hypothetical protein
LHLARMPRLVAQSRRSHPEQITAKVSTDERFSAPARGASGTARAAADAGRRVPNRSVWDVVTERS